LPQSSALCIGLEGETGDFKCLTVNLKPRSQRGFSLWGRSAPLPIGRVARLTLNWAVRSH
jgi:hypothetical protein